MNVNDFEFIARLLKERSGLVLGEDKAYLLESRLNPVARQYGFKGFDELAQAIRLGRHKGLLDAVTEAMTINESYFFRDIKPFDQFGNIVLPRLLDKRASRKSFRIWCAACANGQEPYSLAMILKENEARLAGWQVDILATDISKEALAKAKAGQYSQFEVQRGLPFDLMVKYFKLAEECWQIDDSIRKIVTYKYFNLLDDFTSLGSFDVVFCRNVLIYFDQATKSKVLDNIAELISEDGFLYLGGAETVLGISDRFKPIPGERGIYGLVKNVEGLVDGSQDPAGAGDVRELVSGDERRGTPSGLPRSCRAGSRVA